jgi:hypothetical protein
MSDEVGSATSKLVDAITNLEPEEEPNTVELRSAWRDLGATWTVAWARSLGRDLTNAAAALDCAETAGATEDGAAEVENALWRVDAAFEKLHDVIALGLGVSALKLTKNRKGIKRFEADRRANRKRLRELAEQQAVAQTLLDVDEQIGNQRFLELRHQLTHSLAPILAWQSLLWFEVAEIDEKGGVVAYSSRHLTPSERIQGVTPPDQLYARTISEGREAIELMRRAILALAELLTVAGKLEPPPVLWRVMQTGEIFFDRAEASQAARAASGYVSPFDPS